MVSRWGEEEKNQRARGLRPERKKMRRKGGTVSFWLQEKKKFKGCHWVDGGCCVWEELLCRRLKNKKNQKVWGGCGRRLGFGGGRKN